MSVQPKPTYCDFSTQTEFKPVDQTSLARRIGKAVAITFLVLGASSACAGLMRLGLGGMLISLSELGIGTSLPVILLQYPAIIAAIGFGTTLTGLLLWQFVVNRPE